jgi:thymidylate synthase (FAD)
MGEEMAATLKYIQPDAEQFMIHVARVSSDNQDNPEYERLLTYCMKHGHWSVFEMVDVVMEIYTSRAVSAQILRHRSFHFQEFSQRYADPSKIEMDLPKMRKKGASNRQSSLPYTDPEMQFSMDNKALASVLYSVRTYQDLVDSGVALESARLILPMCVGTRLYMKGTVRDWMHYCRVRMTPHTQAEHREIATDCWNVLKEVLPVTTGAFEKYHMTDDEVKGLE